LRCISLTRCNSCCTSHQRDPAQVMGRKVDIPPAEGVLRTGRHCDVRRVGEPIDDACAYRFGCFRRPWSPSWITDGPTTNDLSLASPTPRRPAIYILQGQRSPRVHIYVRSVNFDASHAIDPNTRRGEGRPEARRRFFCPWQPILRPFVVRARYQVILTQPLSFESGDAFPRPRFSASPRAPHASAQCARQARRRRSSSPAENPQASSAAGLTSPQRNPISAPADRPAKLSSLQACFHDSRRMGDRQTSRPRDKHSSDRARTHTGWGGSAKCGLAPKGPGNVSFLTSIPADTTDPQRPAAVKQDARAPRRCRRSPIGTGERQSAIWPERLASPAALRRSRHIKIKYQPELRASTVTPDNRPL